MPFVLFKHTVFYSLMFNILPSRFGHFYFLISFVSIYKSFYHIFVFKIITLISIMLCNSFLDLFFSFNNFSYLVLNSTQRWWPNTESISEGSSHSGSISNSSFFFDCLCKLERNCSLYLNGDFTHIFEAHVVSREFVKGKFTSFIKRWIYYCLG